MKKKSEEYNAEGEPEAAEGEYVEGGYDANYADGSYEAEVNEAITEQGQAYADNEIYAQATDENYATNEEYPAPVVEQPRQKKLNKQQASMENDDELNKPAVTKPVNKSNKSENGPVNPIHGRKGSQKVVPGQEGNEDEEEAGEGDKEEEEELKKYVNDEKWGFSLTPGLEGGKLCLAPDEQIVSSWSYDCKALTTKEWWATFFTCGLYYLISRIYYKRSRTYSLYITNKRMIVKEEFFENYGCMCPVKTLLENQSSYPIAQVKYVCVEHQSEKFFGLIPRSVTLEIQVVSAPAWNSLPPIGYEYGSGFLIKASLHSIKATYGIDYEAPATTIIRQIAAASSKLSDPSTLLYLVIQFFIGIGLQCFYYALDIGKLLSGTPVEGSKQVVGHNNAHIFRWEANIESDPECETNLQNVLTSLTERLPTNQSLSPDMAPDLDRKMKYLDGFKDKMSAVNQNRDYGDYEGFVYYTNMMPLVVGEVFCDACADNYVFTWEDVLKLITTIGSYYHFVLSDKLNHWTVSYYLTDRRLIRQQLLFAPMSNKMKYARSEFWFVETTATACFHRPEKDATFGIRAREGSSFIVGNDTFSLDFRIRCEEFGFRLLKCMMSHRTKRAKSERKIAPSEELQAEAPMTLKLMERDERIESVAFSAPKMGSCICLLSGGFSNFPRSVLTLTNYGMYLEGHDNSFWSKKKNSTLTFIGWNEMYGSYWSNFQRWESCPGMMTYTCCLYHYYVCGRQPEDAPVLKRTFCETGDDIVPPHGFSGGQVRVNMGPQDNSFGFGLGKSFSSFPALLLLRFFVIL
jgi:hypothetical protein